MGTQLNDTNQAVRRRPGPFGPAKALLPQDQDVLFIEHSTPVFDAIDRMKDTGYSQLPVQQNNRVIGVFSWRSFGKRVSDLRSATVKTADLCARDCMEPSRFIGPEVYIDTETDWGDIDYVLVGAPEGLIGILCVADVFGRLNDFAEAFVLLYEIEHEVRDLIAEVVDEARLCQLIAGIGQPTEAKIPKSLSDWIATAPNKDVLGPMLERLAKPAGRVPTALAELSFDQYRNIITSRDNWSLFASAFASMREIVDADFKEVTQLRNTVFHFRRGITPKDTDRLRRFRDGLRYDREVFHRQRAGSHPLQG
jgi:hypothetical protein